MNSSDRLIEQVLVLRCQVGDKDAFAELIERYQAPLRYFISRLSANNEMTEDIFQETWLTVIRRICSFKRTEAVLKELRHFQRGCTVLHVTRFISNSEGKSRYVNLMIILQLQTILKRMFFLPKMQLKSIDP